MAQSSFDIIPHLVGVVKRFLGSSGRPFALPALSIIPYFTDIYRTKPHPYSQQFQSLTDMTKHPKFQPRKPTK